MNGVITTGEYDSEELLEKLRAFQVKDAVKAVSVPRLRNIRQWAKRTK